MLDIQTKKKLFFDKKAHAAPVRDISLYESSQDVIVSCGYDCNINIFDLRKRSMVQQYKQVHPMSTVCVSPCGIFCVAGNLKGDVISYDFRCMKEPLDTQRIHDSAVVRVGFIPSVNCTSDISTPERTDTCSNLETTTSMYVSATSGRDSFAKFVDLCHYNNLATAEVSTPNRNDSWTDLMPAKRCHDFSMESMAETPTRMSIGNRSEFRLKLMPRTSLDRVVSKVGLIEQTDCETDAAKPNAKFNDHFAESEEITEEDGDTHVRMEDKEQFGLHNASTAMGRKRRSTFHESFFSHIKSMDSQIFHYSFIH